MLKLSRADPKELRFTFTPVNQDQLIDDVTVEPDYVDDGVSTRFFIDYERLSVVLLKAVQG